MSVINQQIEESRGLTVASEIVHGGKRPKLNDEVAKLLAFFLREGECDAWILSQNIEARFSWLQRRKPSTYFGRLAPGLVGQLMEYGGIDEIGHEAIMFPIGPAECRSGLYHFAFEKKWIMIEPLKDQILIRVRDKKSSLANPLPITY